jgi:hypothetical protein
VTLQLALAGSHILTLVCSLPCPLALEWVPPPPPSPSRTDSIADVVILRASDSDSLVTFSFDVAVPVIGLFRPSCALHRALTITERPFVQGEGITTISYSFSFLLFAHISGTPFMAVLSLFLVSPLLPLTAEFLSCTVCHATRVSSSCLC